MAELKEEVKTFIVQAHACFRKPSLIIKDVGAEFGVTITRDQVHFYHPEKAGARKRLGAKWKVLFDATRAAFVKGEVDVGIAKQVYRLKLYQRAAEYYEERGNLVLAAEMAEKAAKEVGGAFTNRRELTGRGGEPLVPPDIAATILKVYGNGGSDSGDGGAGK
jgi:hypothetical protein